MPAKNKVAAFDTRLTLREINKRSVLAFFVRISGASAYAAKHIADRINEKRGELILPPEGFFMDGMEGPLVQGELERVVNWTKKIIAETL